MAVHPPHRAPPHGTSAHGTPAHRPPVPPRRRRSRLGPLLGLVFAIAAAALAWRYFTTPKGPDPQELLLDQIHQAAEGVVVSPHAYGGMLAMAKRDGHINVTVTGLPNGACVQAGWQLAREGTVIVNGVLPQRISAARLSELCSMEPKGATLVWAPDTADQGGQ